MEGYRNAAPGVAAAIVGAYGLHHPMMIENLISIWKGDLKRNLLLGGWLPGDPLKTYWSIFESLFPALHESLTINFEARPITGTTVEQTFTLTSIQVAANNCASTTAKNM
jgi:hypothetical protein